MYLSKYLTKEDQIIWLVNLTMTLTDLGDSPLRCFPFFNFQLLNPKPNL